MGPVVSQQQLEENLAYVALGRSEGAEIDFPIVPREDGTGDNVDKIACYTTRVDTIYGCTYMALAPEHPELKNLVAGLPQEVAASP